MISKIKWASLFLICLFLIYFNFLSKIIVSHYLEKKIDILRSSIDSKDIENIRKHIPPSIKWAIYNDNNDEKEIINDFFYLDELNEGIIEDEYRNKLLMIKGVNNYFLMVKFECFFKGIGQSCLTSHLNRTFMTGYTFDPGESLDFKEISLIGSDKVYPLSLLFLLFTILMVVFICLNKDQILDILLFLTVSATFLIHNFEPFILIIILGLLFFKSKNISEIVYLILSLLLTFFIDTPFTVFFLMLAILKFLKFKGNKYLLFIFAFLFIFALALRSPLSIILLPLLIVFLKKDLCEKFPSLMIFLWFSILLFSLTFNRYSGFEHTVSSKISDIQSNRNIKNAILQNNMNFVGFLINEFYFNNQNINIMFYDNEENLIDSYSSDLFRTQKMYFTKGDFKTTVRIDDTDYLNHFFIREIKHENKDIGYFSIEFLREKGFGIEGILRFLRTSGKVFILMIILILLVFFNWIQENYRNIYNNFIFRIFILYFIGGLLVFIVFNGIWRLESIEKRKGILNNNAHIYLNNLNKESDLLYRNLMGLIKNIEPGYYSYENAEIFIRNSDIEAEGWYFDQNETSKKLYYSKQINGKSFSILFRDLLFRLDKMGNISITVYKEGVIVFNSNIRGIIKGIIPSYLVKGTDISFRNHLFYSKVLDEGHNVLLSSRIDFPEINMLHYLGIFFLSSILVLLSIYIIARYVLRNIGVLKNAFIQLRSGNISYQIDSGGNTDFDVLFKDFNFMAKRLSESRKKELEHETLKNMENIAKKIAHEIKNPLTPIKMLIDHLILLYENDKVEFETQFTECTQIINEQVDYLKQLSQDFYNLGKMSQLKKERILFNDVLKEIHLLYENVCKKNNIELKLIYIKEDVHVKADRNVIRHIFMNIIQNSLDALKEKAGTIILNADLMDGNVKILIEDSGGGIEDELLEKIFMADFSKKKAGLGIGLAYSKQEIEAHGGKITAKNGSSGLIIEIFLPIC